MKKFATLLTITTILSNSASAQHELGLGLGSPRVLQRPKGIDVLSSTDGFVYFQHKPLKLKGGFVIHPQICLSQKEYIMDGAFLKGSTNQIEFVNTPANYKQSVLSMYSVRIPVFVKYPVLVDKEKFPRLYLGIAPYGEYFFGTQQRYKIGDNNYKDKIRLDKNFQAGIATEISAYRRHKKSVSIHLGAQYQMTDYLNETSSFKPLVIYGKLGVCF